MPYVSPAPEPDIEPDAITVDFNHRRQAFLFLGSFCHRKGVDLLLKAAARVLKNTDKWTLILVGNDTRDKKYQRLAEKLGLACEVLFRGSVNPDQIGSMTACASVLVLPSPYDGWGLAINEGVLGGLAIIASHRCGAARHLGGSRIQRISRSGRE